MAARTCRAIALVLVVLFLASAARFYHRDTGFTSLIGFPEGHASEVPALRAVPHHEYPAIVSYDGQYYAQLALDPLVRDAATDRAMDVAPYRARRILFSWTAWLLGLGRPWWILQAYALQNVVCWILLAWLLRRWIRPDSPRGLAAWSACLFSFGMLWSVRFSLLDGPSLALLACAIVASERARTFTAAGIVGVAVLGRETNVLGASVLPVPSDRRGWLRLLPAVLLVVLPIAIWFDYLWSIYRTTTFDATAGQLTVPVVSYLKVGRIAVNQLSDPGSAQHGQQVLLSIAALHAQAAYLVLRRDLRSLWWRLAIVYVPLMLTAERALWEPGGINRFLLPMTVGFNVLLAQSSAPFWPWFVAGNLTLYPALERVARSGFVL